MTYLTYNDFVNAIIPGAFADARIAACIKIMRPTGRESPCCLGPYKVHGNPWHFSETPAKIGIAPESGAHNDAVLTDLGYDKAEIADLRARKIVR